MSETVEWTVWVNGAERKLAPVPDVLAMIEALGIPAASVLVEQNGVALLRSDWAECPVKHGDRFELLTVVAGG